MSNGDTKISGSGGDNASPPEATAQSVASLQKELAEVKDQLLRALAEQQNIRRRGAREAQDALKFAVADMSRDLLTTADNLRRAIESVPLQKSDTEAVRQWLAGVTATEQALLETFARHGIRRIAPIDQPFDPNYHQAAFTVRDDEQPRGTVIKVVQPGYTLHERLLRPAMVGVSSGSGSSSPEEQKAPSGADAS